MTPPASIEQAPPPIRQLVLVLGDQLDADSAAFDGFDPATDLIWMAELAHESTKVWSGKARSVVFLSAMRHFRDALRLRGWPLIYHELTADSAVWNGVAAAGLDHRGETFSAVLAATLRHLQPHSVVLVEPGEWQVKADIEACVAAAGIAIDVREDRHFLCTRAQFARHANGRRELRMEYFYREMRVRHAVLMADGKPLGGEWNFDAQNRSSFGKAGPPAHSPPRAFPPDAITRDVIAVVEARFGDHPGDLTVFDWPVTAADAELALEDFIRHRLPAFGEWQDAMWSAEPWLFHSRLSAAMNLKLLDPRRVIAAAEAALHEGLAPLAAVEGFIRQILGWREYVRGIYWQRMPGYIDLNALAADRDLPGFYWTGDTDMACLRDAIGQTLTLGYAHHIQRLMVTGLYALLFGVEPRQVHAWYLAVYVDAVEWVELPNTLGMSQYADGGLMASKPYVASGQYIQRMSNHCRGCRFDPAESLGPTACPFTTLYWDFLIRHHALLAHNPRMTMPLRNLDRISSERRAAIQARALQWRERGSHDAATEPRSYDLFDLAAPTPTGKS